MNAGKIFIIEDDEMVAAIIRQTLVKFERFETHVFQTAEECIAHLHEQPDIILIDYNLPGMDGLSLLKKVKSACPSVLVIVCSGQEDVQVVVSCYQQGANDYILKNDQMLAAIENSVRNLSMNVTLRKEVEFLKDQIIDRNKYSNIIGNSHAVLRVLRLIQKV